MSQPLLLTDLTTTMMREVFQAITDSAMEQTEAYVDLAGRVGVPLDVYQGKILGVTPEERALKAASYVSEVVYPLLAQPAPSVPVDPVTFDDAGKQALLTHYQGTNAGSPNEMVIDDVIQGQSPSFAVALDDLLTFTLAKLLRDTKRSYDQLRALLGSGMQQIVVTGGQICTKVTMQVEEPSAPPPSSSTAVTSPKSTVGLRVKLADERSAALSRSAELVGSVKIDFRTTTFPALPLSISTPSASSGGQVTTPPALPAAPTSLGEPLKSIWGSGPTDIYITIAGQQAIFYKGKSGWTRQELGVNVTTAIWGSGQGDIYLGGVDPSSFASVVCRSKGGGAPWKGFNVPTKLVSWIWGSGPNDVYAIGGDPGSSVVLHSKGDDHWEIQATDLAHGNPLTAIWGTDKGNVYAIGLNGVIIHTKDGGANWVLLDSGTTVTLNGIWGSGPNDVYVVGDYGVILHSSDGVHWVKQTSNTYQALYGIWGSGPNAVYAAGDFGRILRSTDGGASWTPSRLGTADEQMRCVWGSGPSDVYVTCSSGILLRSTDGGINWG